MADGFNQGWIITNQLVVFSAVHKLDKTMRPSVRAK
jgi:hypothetical protein